MWMAIFMGTNFCGLNKNDTFVGFNNCGHSISFHNSYRKLLFRGYWNSWIGPSTKIGTPRNLSHSQYSFEMLPDAQSSLIPEWQHFKECMCRLRNIHVSMHDY